jgi:hypothetical protein
MTPIVFMRAALVAGFPISAATVLPSYRLVTPKGLASVSPLRRCALTKVPQRTYDFLP